MTIPTKQAGGGYSQTQTVGLMDDSSFGIPNSVEFCKSSNSPLMLKEVFHSSEID